MSIRAAIFDIYGTLLEVGPAPASADARWERLFRDMLHAEPPLSRLGFSIASNKVVARHHDLARTRSIPWPEIQWPSVVTEVVPELTQLSRPDQEEFIYQQIQTGHTTGMRAEAAGTLRWLRQQPCLLGIASNAQVYTLRELQEALATHGLELGLFEPELRFWSFQHGFSKPDPHVFQILTARLETRGVRPPEILMVGDRADNDIAPAQAHGWRTWHLGASGDGDWIALRDALAAWQ